MLLISGMVSWRTATSPGPGRGIETCREVGVEKCLVNNYKKYLILILNFILNYLFYFINFI